MLVGAIEISPIFFSDNFSLVGVHGEVSKVVGLILIPRVEKLMEHLDNVFTAIQNNFLSLEDSLQFRLAKHGAC